MDPFGSANESAAAASVRADGKKVSAIDKKPVGGNRQQASDDAKMLIEAAGICYSDGKYAEAEDLLLQAVQVREGSFGTEHRKLAPLLNCLGLTYTQMKEFDKAEVAFRRGLSIVRSNPRPGRFREIELAESYINMLRQAGRSAQAQELERSIRILQSENKLINGLMRSATPSISFAALKLMELLEEAPQPTKVAIVPATLIFLVALILLAVLIVLLVK